MAQGCRELEPERTGRTRLLACEVAEEQKVLIQRSHLCGLRQVPSGECAFTSAFQGYSEQEAFLGF